MSVSPCLQHVRDFWAESLRDKGRGVQADYQFREMTIEEATPGRMVARLPLQNYHLNGLGSVHGGIIMTLTDIVSWVGLQTEGLPMIPTVSANMSAEFVRPAGGAGDVLWIVANKIQRGRKLAFSRIEFYLNDLDSRVCAYGNHTQVVTREVTLTHRFSEDGQSLIPVEKTAAKAKL